MEPHMPFQLVTGQSRHNNAVVVLRYRRCRPEPARRRGVERGGRDGQLQRHQPLRHRDIPRRLQGEQTGKKGEIDVKL